MTGVDTGRHAPEPGWYPDPSGRFAGRRWDGGNWTADVSLDGSPTLDPLITGTQEDALETLRQFDHEVQRRRHAVDVAVSQAMHQDEVLRQHEGADTAAAVGLALGSFGGCLGAVLGTIGVVLGGGLLLTLLVAVPPLGIIAVVASVVALVRYSQTRRRRKEGLEWFRRALPEQLAYDQARQLFDPSAETIGFRAAGLVLRDATRRLIDKYLSAPKPPANIEAVAQPEIEALFQVERAAAELQAVPWSRMEEADVRLAQAAHACEQAFQERFKALTAGGTSARG